jgi:hypothetical protein
MKTVRSHQRVATEAPTQTARKAPSVGAPHSPAAPHVSSIEIDAFLLPQQVCSQHK